MGCEDFASFSEERRRAGGHFGSSPLINPLNTYLEKGLGNFNHMVFLGSQTGVTL